MNGEVVDYPRGASEDRAFPRNQQIDMRPRQACTRVTGLAKGAIVKSAEMVLLENALSVVNVRAKQLNKACWCCSGVVRVATLKPTNRT
jgi:hypothetical protein